MGPVVAWLVDNGARESSSNVHGSVHDDMRRSDLDGGAALQGDDHEPKGVYTVTSSAVFFAKTMTSTTQCLYR